MIKKCLYNKGTLKNFLFCNNIRYIYNDIIFISHHKKIVYLKQKMVYSEVIDFKLQCNFSLKDLLRQTKL